jgi:hypothetical protein
MDIKIICFGKMDANGYSLLEKNYLEKLKRFCRVDVVALKEETTPDLKKNQQKKRTRLGTLLTRNTGCQDLAWYCGGCSIRLKHLPIKSLVSMWQPMQQSHFSLVPVTGFRLNFALVSQTKFRLGRRLYRTNSLVLWCWNKFIGLLKLLITKNTINNFS